MSQTLIIVLNGPSAVGKSTLMEHLATRDSALFRKLESVTTRSRRWREDESPYSSGPEYRFVNYREFKNLVAAWRIVQSGEFRGCLYGLDLWHMRLQLGSRHGVIALTRSGIDVLSRVPDLAPRMRIVAVRADPMTIRWNMKRRGASVDEIESEMPTIAAHAEPFQFHATVTNLGRMDSIWQMAESLKSQLGIEAKD